jgi:HSP20 family molecular chaperone IbpA
MKKRKPSFFERLTGSVPADEYAEYDDRYEYEQEPAVPAQADRRILPQAPTDSELSVDVMQTGDEIVIRAVVAGVRPEDLDINITRDMVTIHGERTESTEAADEDYFHRELYWGSFSRTVVLPAEVEVEEAQAYEKHGILEIHLPKINREKQTRLKVKSQ